MHILASGTFPHVISAIYLLSVYDTCTFSRTSSVILIKKIENLNQNQITKFINKKVINSNKFT